MVGVVWQPLVYGWQFGIPSYAFVFPGGSVSVGVISTIDLAGAYVPSLDLDGAYAPSLDLAGAFTPTLDLSGAVHT